MLTGRRLIATLIVLIGSIGLCGLGMWQLDRHAQRAALNARIAAGLAQSPVALETVSDLRSLDYRPVTARGIFDPAHEVLLRNRSLNGMTGYHVITPLRLSGRDEAVLVDRGWIPLTEASPEARRRFAPSPGETLVTGIARQPETYVGGPQDPPLTADRPRIDAWFRVDVARIQEQTPYPLLPIFIEMQPVPDAPPTLPQPVPPPEPDQGPHLGYAIQWFGFAVILVVGYVAFQRKMLEAQRD
ncbi:MAG: SURF1 family protein [Roseiflexaceae bacterium]|nr:SURF1 family protein [Roseiflexaceae bacterium]